ncbi:hypothetical protein F511_09700 [Dorcoceras hygrometricum]|uniref:Uncharacterized protein n=1 Tax=Dorcoceras hygrometricum TaxID=472368 RepID=A0A2Z7CP98_9LAMI|nr:hypothetical protein F511_09700 [Dorcoceras hygrometricum]
MQSRTALWAPNVIQFFSRRAVTTSRTSGTSDVGDWRVCAYTCNQRTFVRGRRKCVREAPPMLKSAVRARANESKCGKALVKTPSAELYACLLIAFALYDAGDTCTMRLRSGCAFGRKTRSVRTLISAVDKIRANGRDGNSLTRSLTLEQSKLASDATFELPEVIWAVERASLPCANFLSLSSTRLVLPTSFSSPCKFSLSTDNVFSLYYSRRAGFLTASLVRGEILQSEVLGHLLHQGEGGMSDSFEVMIPGLNERAHRPPRGFHSFYINQLEMGLRFPRPRFTSRSLPAYQDKSKSTSPQSYSFLFLWLSSSDTTTCLWSPTFLCNADERMGKAELVKAMQEEARASGEVGQPTKAVKKRPAASSAEEEAHREKRAKKKGASTSGTRPGEDPKMTREPTPMTLTSEETPDQPPVITILEASSPARGKGPERALPLDFSKDSLVDSPTGVVATKFICNMVPDRDLLVLKRAKDIEAVGHFAANLTSAMDWGGEVVRRLTRAHRTGLRAQDEVVAVTQRKELEAELAAEKEARAAEKRALGAELERANARAERVKEDFLKSPEFDSLLEKKAWGYFKDGFWGCLAQFRSNGYSEEEHPASFLNLQQALENLGDDDDAEDEEEEQEEGEVGDDTEANTPNSPKP